MEKITTILVDDEPRNNQLLQNLLQAQTPQLQIAGAYTHTGEALEAIERLQPQLVYMDIEMPGLNGFELLTRLEPVNFEVIFVTAYNQYAVEAFEHHAIGYITKPVNTAKLVNTTMAAIERVRQRQFNQRLFTMLESSMQSSREQKIPLTTLTGMVFVRLDEIIYCESSGNYTHFYLTGKRTVLVSRQLGEYEKLLPAGDFIRIHDRHIINLKFIKEYHKGSGGDILLDDGTTLAVAARRKDEFLSLFDKWLRRR